MAKGLDGKKVVIIGGSSGIGLAVAEGAIAEGAFVVVASSQSANVAAAVGRLGNRAEAGPVDVRDEASVARFFGEVGVFDHLVYTAGDWGVFGPAVLADLDLAAAREGMTVRFWGALAAIKHGHRSISPGGSITLTDGVIAHRPPKGFALASAMAGAIEHLTRGLAQDLAPVRVNAVCPGLVLTDRNRQMPDEMMQRFVGGQPLAHAGAPDDVAEAYLHLMRAGYTTGQVLIVDGGRTVV